MKLLMSPKVTPVATIVLLVTRRSGSRVPSIPGGIVLDLPHLRQCGIAAVRSRIGRWNRVSVRGQVGATIAAVDFRGDDSGEESR